MDGTIKQSRRFAELERLSDDYFRYHLASVMDETRDYLARKQGEEMKEYSTSLGGVLSMMASSAQPLNDPYQLLKVTGEWNSKTTEDYVEMCKEKIAASEDIQHDLAYMAGQWRDAVVKEIGRERYDELSEQLGGDLAYAYMDYRLEQQMIDKLVKDRMPKSSADYIIRKAAESSLFGLPQMLSRSPLAEEIEKRGEAAYRPSKVEQGAGWLLGASADTVMLGGAGSWAAFARFIGVDAAVSATMAHLEPEDPKSISVEQCISQGVFGSEHNVFEDFRREAATMTADKDSFTATANEQLKKQIPVCNFNFTDWMKKQQPFPFLKGLQDKLKQERPERYKDVPLVVAPGQEEAYLKSLEEKKQTDAEEPEQVHQETVQPEKEPEAQKSEQVSQEQTEQRQTAAQTAIPSPTDQPSKEEKEEKTEPSSAQAEEIKPISPISPIGPGRLEGLWEKIGGQLAKAERIWYEYKSYPRKHEILQAVWKAIRRFLHSLRLRDSVLRIRYGLENPADTGYITAVSAIVGQYFDNRGCRFELEPEFQEPCLEVQGKLRLHIDILQCAWIGCALVLNHDVRRLIMYILHRKK